jgi:RimJ/RimL family protein N-acetyltransferase
VRRGRGAAGPEKQSRSASVQCWLVGVRILRVDPDDAATLATCLAVQAAAKQREDPFGPPKTARVLRVFLAEGFEAFPCESWYTSDGFYWLELPDRENLHLARLILVTRPDAGEPAVKEELLGHALARARQHGRTMISTMARPGTALDEFLRGAGARPGILEARRVLDLRKMPTGLLATIRETAAEAAAGYSLARWSGRTPERHLQGVADLFNAMNDAPREESEQEAVWDADRVRERADSSLIRMGVRGYSVTAICDATGEMAALTQLEVDPDDPQWGHQGLTAVTRPHRGHRLGLLVKAAMLQWLADAEPDLNRIETGNADSNEHMIAINSELGFAVSGEPHPQVGLVLTA